MRPATPVEVEVADEEEGTKLDDQRGSINQPVVEVGAGLASGPAAVKVEQESEVGRLAQDGGDTRRAREEENEEQEENDWGWGRDGRRFGPAWLAVVTFVHEVWLLLQHANILMNPLCQRLDRSYGVALVRMQSRSWCLVLVLVSKKKMRGCRWFLRRCAQRDEMSTHLPPLRVEAAD